MSTGASNRFPLFAQRQRSQAWQRSGAIQRIPRGDQAYPASLLRLPRPPADLYLLGDQSLLVSRAVAVVGARGATMSALRFAERLAQQLVGRGVTVVSGGAIGVDGAAHDGALAADGKTVAVLGSGLDRPYPERNLALFDRIASSGALVTPFAPDEPPRRGHFPQRNALIAALAQLVVVVEAARRSGALNTARWARELAVPVAAVPGSAGCQPLICAGATPVREPGEVLGLLEGNKPPGTSAAPLTSDELRLLELIGQQSDCVDGLARRAALPVPRVAALLLRLEIEGRVQRGERPDVYEV